MYKSKTKNYICPTSKPTNIPRSSCRKPGACFMKRTRLNEDGRKSHLLELRFPDRKSCPWVKIEARMSESWEIWIEVSAVWIELGQNKCSSEILHAKFYSNECRRSLLKKLRLRGNNTGSFILLGYWVQMYNVLCVEPDYTRIRPLTQAHYCEMCKGIVVIILPCSFA